MYLSGYLKYTAHLEMVKHCEKIKINYCLLNAMYIYQVLLENRESVSVKKAMQALKMYF